MTGLYERRLTATMADPDDMDQVNVIHANSGAREFGYRAALLGGVIVYGWAIPPVLDALGVRWLDEGWADVSFRRPVYPGDEITAAVTRGEDAEWSLVIANGAGEACVTGTFGMGNAPWLSELRMPADVQPQPRPNILPRLELATAPIGRDLRAMAVPIPEEEARRFALEEENDDDPLWSGARPLVHPGWMAGRMTRLLHHSFDYGPSIHARSQLQNLARAEAGQALTVAGVLVDAYERKGHHYAVADGLVLSEDGRQLCRMRHTTVFQVARR